MNSGLRNNDDTRGKELRHKIPSIVDDEFTTPWDVYYDIIKHFKIAPQLDVFATHKNSKCTWEITKEENAFVTEWLLPDGKIGDIWCNHPHSDHPRTLYRIEQEYQRYNFNVINLIPVNVMKQDYFHDLIEPHRYTLENQQGHIHFYPYWDTIRFEKHGKPTKDSSRNAYMILVWRSKHK